MERPDYMDIDLRHPGVTAGHIVAVEEMLASIIASLGLDGETMGRITTPKEIDPVDMNPSEQGCLYSYYRVRWDLVHRHGLDLPEMWNSVP